MADQFKEAMNRMSQNMPKGAPKMPGAPGPAAAGAVGMIVGAGALAYGAYHSIFQVEGGQRAIMFNRVVGLKSNHYGEGVNFNIPWFERPIIYDIRTRPCNLQTLTGSKDLQMVEVGVRVLHRPNSDNLVWIYQHLGMNYDQRLLPSIMNECAKAVVARYNASELLTRRAEVSLNIAEELKARALKFNVILEDIAITHLAFSPEYAKAVEAKQVGESALNLYCGNNANNRRWYLTFLSSHFYLFFHLFGLQLNRTLSVPSTLCWEHNKRS
jgi:prohibitin 2